MASMYTIARGKLSLASQVRPEGKRKAITLIVAAFDYFCGRLKGVDNDTETSTI